MTRRITPKTNSTPIDDLINIALTETDESLAWDAVFALHWRGSFEVLCRAEALSQSECPQERRLAADILGQLGTPDRAFSRQSAGRLIQMLERENDAIVAESILIALSHHDAPDVVVAAQPFATHPDGAVRRAVAFAIAGYEAPSAIDSLIRLSNDVQGSVRDWATFALGTQLKVDSPEIREALAARLDDNDDNARGEAMVGLASRKDPRVIAAIRKNLTSGAMERAIEAAVLIESPELFGDLVALRGVTNLLPSFLEDAIEACSPS